MNQKKPVYIAIAMALVALLLGSTYIKKQEQKLIDRSHPVPVLIAKVDILKNMPVEENMVAVQEVPKAFLQPGALSHPAEAIGRLTSSPVMKGEQLLGTKLITYGDDTGLAVKIPQGMRALSVRVDPVSGVGGLIKPDNYVDILSTFNFGDEVKDDYRTFTLFENVRVLAVGKDLGVGLADASQDKQVRSRNRRDIEFVTLAVDPQQVQDILLAQNSGELYLSLRSLSESDKSFRLKPSSITNLTGIKQRTTQKVPVYRSYRGR